VSASGDVKAIPHEGTSPPVAGTPSRLRASAGKGGSKHSVRNNLLV